MALSARDLFGKLDSEAAPLVLDVRNRDEFSRWKVEARRPVDALNVPYFDFIESEDASVAVVQRWRAGRDRGLVVVCAKGDSSEFVAELLRRRGMAAENLTGGMRAWGRETVERPVETRAPLQAWQVLRFGKGCLSYVLASGRYAIVVDPHRRIEAYGEFLERHKLELKGVFDTHLQADHISGGPELSRKAGVPYYVHPRDFEGARFDYRPLQDGQSITLGEMKVVPFVVLHTPGHTPGSVVLVVNQALLLTGDTMFVDGFGRPDLGGKTDEWGRDLYRSLRNRFAMLGDHLLVLPAHSAGPQEMKPDGTIWERLGTLRRKNAAALGDEEAFLRAIHEAQGPAPAAYATIRRVNLGQQEASEEDKLEMELGRNECALSRR